MTDKRLKTLLTPATMEDEEFVNRVMANLPKTDLSWRPVWTIRLVALAIAIAILLWSSELSILLNDILQLAHGSWTMILFAGLFVAGSALYICREKEII